MELQALMYLAARIENCPRTETIKIEVYTYDLRIRILNFILRK